jgi:hypothetical protein
MPDRSHPEGLGHPPEGPGFTVFSVKLPAVDGHRWLLGHANIEAVRKNEPEAFTAALDALPSFNRDPRTGRVTRGFSEDERSSLAALAVLVDHGMFHRDRIVEGPTLELMYDRPRLSDLWPERDVRPGPDMAGDDCDCEECSCGK